MKSLQNLLREYKEEPEKHERLGQYFINRYHEGQWPELFYEEAMIICLLKITRWLKDNQYIDELPTRREL